MTVQMVRGDVQDSADIRPEVHDRLQLEAADLRHGHAGVLRLEGDLSVGNSDVAHHMDILEF